MPVRIPPENRSTRSWPELAAALAFLATPVLSGWLAPLALAALLALLIACKPRRRVVLVASLGAGLAGLLLIGELALENPAADPDRFVHRASREFGAIWQSLDGAAERAAGSFDGGFGREFESSEAFQILSTRVAREKKTGLTLLLVGPRGQVAAWAGHGLLHDLEGRSLPGEGSEVLASFSAASFLSVRSLEDDSSGWRIVAGRSLPVEELPFGSSRWTAEHRQAWLALAPGGSVPSGFMELALEGRPPVAVALPGREISAREVGAGATPARRLVWLVLTLTLGLLAAGGETSRGSPLLWLGAVAGACLAGGLGPGLVALAALASVGASSVWLKPVSPVPRWGALMVGGLSGILVAGVAFLMLATAGPKDLGSELWPSPQVLLVRLVLFSLVVSLLGRVRRPPDAEVPSSPAALWVTLVSLGLAAAGHDWIGVALPALAMAGGSAALWIRREFSLGSVAPGTARSTIAVCILASLIAAVGWETAYRNALLRETSGPVLAATGPPTTTELVAISGEIERHFSKIDLERMAPAGPAGLETQDLAYEIWRHSPLARGGVLSAVSVSLPDGGRSSFSFGIPTTEEGHVDWSPARWDTLGLPVWDSFVIAGEERLRFEGRSWGEVRFWQLLRPGFRMDEPIRRDLAARLLRGGPTATLPAAGLAGPTHYALYSPSGRARISPWKAPPVISSELLPAGSGSIDTPEGPARVFTQTADDGLRALFLMRMEPLEALERTGAHALGLVSVLGLVGLGWWLIGSSWRDRLDTLRLTFRSYSRRLVLVYSVLALLPMLLVNLVFVRVTSERLEKEQLVEGSAALESAQRVLGEYLLSLEPGFGIDSALDDELLGWLSGVVQHEVNLYWRSSVWASSRPELFTAGLLPTRIPGEIHSRLSRGVELSARTNRAGETEYLELYAPLRVPGMPAEEEVRLVVSTPLLAQQEELAEDLASLRLRTILATTFLVLLLAGLGARLARSFSDPLMEVVRGTQRIAAGETSLQLAPTETELATLVGAIDHMAGRIADGRTELLREKRMVESMVESITSGVVSLDVDRRVVLRNRVAAELLGVEVGEPLESALARRDELRPISDFLASAGNRIERGKFELPGGEGEDREWSLVWVPLAGGGEPTALLVVEDVTEVLRGQRLEAWAEMARIIAHEIKNPLTPIRLSTEHMREVHARDPDHFDDVFEACTVNILKQVGELQQISSEFSTYSRIPRIEIAEGDLVTAVREVVDGYGKGPRSGPTVLFSASPDSLEVSFDDRLLGRAVRNLLENAVRACRGGGTVKVSVRADGDRALIAVADTGPGVDPELLARIFDPYFSTHDSGTGLGLPIARRIAEEHGGRIAARNRSTGGLEVEIALPLTETPPGG